MKKNILKPWLWNRVVQVVCVCCWSHPSSCWALELPWLAVEQHMEMDSGAVVPVGPWEELAKTYCQNFLRNTAPQMTNPYLLWDCLLPCCASPLVCSCCVFLCSWWLIPTNCTGVPLPASFSPSLGTECQAGCLIKCVWNCLKCSELVSETDSLDFTDSRTCHPCSLGIQARNGFD